MFRAAKEAGICLVVNSVLNSAKGDLDLSFGSGYYTKYGVKDEKGFAQPIGRFDPASLDYIPTELAQTANCSGWSSITTFKFNNQFLSKDHVPLVLSILTTLPKFRPSTIELKGTDGTIMMELVPAIHELYEGTGLKPKILYMNSPVNARSSGAVGGIGRNNSNRVSRAVGGIGRNNSNNITSRRSRVRPAGTRVVNTRNANAYRAAANALKRAANTKNTSGVSAAVAAALTALGPNENLNLSGPLRNPFKPSSGSAGAAPEKKKSWFSLGGRRKTRRRGAKKLKLTRRHR